jgi:hypothetical protein
VNRIISLLKKSSEVSPFGAQEVLAKSLPSRTAFGVDVPRYSVLNIQIRCGSCAQQERVTGPQAGTFFLSRRISFFVAYDKRYNDSRSPSAGRFVGVRRDETPLYS